MMALAMLWRDLVFLVPFVEFVESGVVCGSQWAISCGDLTSVWTVCEEISSCIEVREMLRRVRMFSRTYGDRLFSRLNFIDLV